jgi:hypothetical protein
MTSTFSFSDNFFFADTAEVEQRNREKKPVVECSIVNFGLMDCE